MDVYKHAHVYQQKSQDVFTFPFHEGPMLSDFSWQAVSRRTLQHARNSDLWRPKGSTSAQVSQICDMCLLLLVSGFRFTNHHLNQSNQPCSLVFPTADFEGICDRCPIRNNLCPLWCSGPSFFSDAARGAMRSEGYLQQPRKKCRKITDI